MDLIDRFNRDMWIAGDPSRHRDFTTYTLIRPKAVAPGKFQYAIKEIRENESEGKIDMVTLDGAMGKTDPLANIRNCDLILDSSDIHGICIDGECVLRKDIKS